MDIRTEKRLAAMFKMVFKMKYVVSDIETADIVIVEVEAQDAVNILAQFNATYEQKPVIIFSDSPVEIDGIICLTQPCEMSVLLDSLKHTLAPKSQKESIDSIKSSAQRTANSLQQKLSPKSSRSSKPLLKQSLINQDSIYYDPDNFLQGKVTRAIKKANQLKKTVFLRCWSQRWIVISPSADFLLENINQRQMANLGLVNIDSDLVFLEEAFAEKQMAAMSETPVSEVKTTTINKFVWDLTVRTARGRIPKGILVDDHYILKQWPNLTRQSGINNSMRISALWIDKAQSINNIAKQLGIPITDVYTYFSAANAIGLFTLAQRKEDNIIKPEVANASENKKGLFSALLRKLSGKAHAK